jgi:hypothetical protein
LVFRLNLVAEGLAHASHAKGEHSKGSLVHDNATGIVFDRNVWAYNVQRSPLIKGGAQVLLVNNLIYSPGIRAVHYNLLADEWQEHAPVIGQITAVGNVLQSGLDSDPGLAFLMIGGVGDLDFFGKDNVALGQDGSPLAMYGRYRESTAQIKDRDSPLDRLDGYDVLLSAEVETYLSAHVGARPWDRGTEDRRVLDNVTARRGHIIDDEKQVGGYPSIAATRAAFRKSRWDLVTMQPKNGIYPGQQPYAKIAVKK